MNSYTKQCNFNQLVSWSRVPPDHSILAYNTIRAPEVFHFQFKCRLAQKVSFASSLHLAIESVHHSSSRIASPHLHPYHRCIQSQLSQPHESWLYSFASPLPQWHQGHQPWRVQLILSISFRLSPLLWQYHVM